MLLFDPLYILISLPALIVAIGAQILVKYYFSKYSNVPNSANLTGVDVVERTIKQYDLDLRLNVSAGDLNDFYDPRNKEITLSEKVARTPSIASIGVTAHELGHALQHKNGFFLAGIRTLMVPVVNIGTMLGYILFLLGFALQIFGLTMLGVALFSLATVFTIVTLPVEIDASVKAMGIIKRTEVLSPYEFSGVKKVLTAAALTYVAAVMQSLSSLLYYVLRAFGSRRD